MEKIWFDELPSTHLHVVEAIKNGDLTKECMTLAKKQTNGIGSRGSEWEYGKGNLFLSMALHKNSLPKDLPLQSTCIYYTQILKNILEKEGSKVWLKWPNDFYLEDKKIGGAITCKVKNHMVVSIGLNLKSAPKGFGVLDIHVDVDDLMQKYIKNIQKFDSWKFVFSNYMLKFRKNHNYEFHSVDGKRLPLRDAKLLEDGTIEINNKKVYSSR